MNSRLLFGVGLIGMSCTLAGCNPELAVAPSGAGGGAAPAPEGAPPAPAVDDGAIEAQVALLRAFGASYWRFLDSQQRAPTGWAEMASLVPPDGAQKMQADGYVISWGLHPRDTMFGTSETVLAYQPAALTDGGFALLLDGSVTQLDAATLAQYVQRQAPPAPNAAQ